MTTQQAATTGRPDGYATGRATKQSIVARAAEAFAQKGFYGASLRGIAREAGVDHSTLLHHFGNKTALLLAVIEWHDAQHAPPSMPSQFTAEDLVDGFVQTAERNREAPGLVQLLSTLSAEAGTPGHPARPVLQERHRVLVGVIGGMIRTQRSRGVLDDAGASPEARAALVISTWEGLQVYDALHPGDVDVPAMVGEMLRREFGVS
ncbi:TetR/AcrR family transcriptional regulator [Oerskovia gallyi]|uniref:TetR/AcrR family transcriptional regulator n=1 Tax=Oerskovia gallyi TaxID=2762226 RepID=A0ABR8UYD2_9CELL|nr:TetR/AcrR family transcriptional regulator [Oerskovia gallyi]MBD7997548.1 TetR/AcrR family transcriptional regulator [Oerskovia gallyi]